MKILWLEGGNFDVSPKHLYIDVAVGDCVVKDNSPIHIFAFCKVSLNTANITNLSNTHW